MAFDDTPEDAQAAYPCVVLGCTGGVVKGTDGTWACDTCGWTPPADGHAAPTTPVTLEVWCSTRGRTLLLVNADGQSGTRLAGPKLVGEGSLIATFTVQRDVLLNALSEA